MSTMDAEHRKKLVRQRAVAKSSLTRLQNLIETGERKLHDLQSRYEELPDILSKFETAQNQRQQMMVTVLSTENHLNNTIFKSNKIH
jgi:carotenoid cleavage dioxygenase-like enzyme